MAGGTRITGPAAAVALIPCGHGRHCSGEGGVFTASPNAAGLSGLPAQLLQWWWWARGWSGGARILGTTSAGSFPGPTLLSCPSPPMQMHKCLGYSSILGCWVKAPLLGN